jgi:hypothetical protein
LQQAQPLQLKDQKPLTRGSYRLIFQHPHDEGLLVKVLSKRAHKPRARRWYKPKRYLSVYRALERELKEYSALEKRGLRDLPFLQKFHGMVDTDLGPGIAVQKLTGRDGELAPTLTKIVERHGLSDDLRRKIIQLREDIVSHAIVFMDVSGNNIVLANGPHGERLVVIDGLGERLLININTMSTTINRMNAARYFERAIKDLEEIDQRRKA